MEKLFYFIIHQNMADMKPFSLLTVVEVTFLATTTTTTPQSVSANEEGPTDVMGHPIYIFDFLI